MSDTCKAVTSSKLATCIAQMRLLMNGLRYAAVATFIPLLDILLAHAELEPTSCILTASRLFPRVFHYEIVVGKAQRSRFEITTGFIFTLNICMPIVATAILRTTLVVSAIVRLLIMVSALLLMFLRRKLLIVRLFGRRSFTNYIW